MSAAMVESSSAFIGTFINARNLAYPARRERVERRPADIRHIKDRADAARPRAGGMCGRGIHACAVADRRIAVSARQTVRPADDRALSPGAGGRVAGA